jgi:hypothetical protein
MTLLTLIEKQKWVIFPSLFNSSNSNYFNHLFAFLDKSPKLTSTTSSMLSMSFGPKLVGLKSSVGMIRFLFIIPTEGEGGILFYLCPTICGTDMKLVNKYQICVINSYWEKCDEKCAYMFNVYKIQLSWQTGSRHGGRGGYTVLPLSFRPSKIFFVAFFSATINGRNLIFDPKLHIGMPYCG